MPYYGKGEAGGAGVVIGAHYCTDGEAGRSEAIQARTVRLYSGAVQKKTRTFCPCLCDCTDYVMRFTYVRTTSVMLDSTFGKIWSL